MDDERVPFDNAKRELVTFLQSQGWPTDLLWVTRDRLIGYRGIHWVFRPAELSSDATSRAFYQATQQTASSIKLAAQWQLGDQALAYVEDVGSPRRKLYFALAADRPPIRPVNSRVAWFCLRVFTRALGESPFLRSTTITPQT